MHALLTLPTLISDDIVLMFVLSLGAFLIPYILCLLLAGMPVFLMEMSIGQVMQTNAVEAWKRICPLFGGKFRMLFLFAPTMNGCIGLGHFYSQLTYL